LAVQAELPAQTLSPDAANDHLHPDRKGDEARIKAASRALMNGLCAAEPDVPLEVLLLLLASAAATRIES
jgi:hypothetical protein